jgi:peptidoglycan/xylan/chitin deacetylase (PgdA/CDA1 family)
LRLFSDLFTPETVQHLAMRTYGMAHTVYRLGAITQGPPVPRVSLTFDDGPHPEWTPKVLDCLDRFGARATFFMVGQALERHPALGREVVARGHEAAVHLYSHSPDAALSNDRFDREVSTSLDLIRDATGTNPAFLRFPFAEFGGQSPRRVRQRFGLRTAHWSFSTRDSRLTARQQVQRVRLYVYPGAIVLAHDGVGPESKYAKTRRTTVEALPQILEVFRLRHLEPVRLDELMGTA